MNNERFKKLIEDQVHIIESLSATKGVEYANSEIDRLANFKRLSAELGMSSTQVLMVYLTKHLDAIRYFVKNNNASPVGAEPVEGRIDDAIMYLLLLKGLIVDWRAGNTRSAE